MTLKRLRKTLVRLPIASSSGADDLAPGRWCTAQWLAWEMGMAVDLVRGRQLAPSRSTWSPADAQELEAEMISLDLELTNEQVCPYMHKLHREGWRGHKGCCTAFRSGQVSGTCQLRLPLPPPKNGSATPHAPGGQAVLAGVMSNHVDGVVGAHEGGWQQGHGFGRGHRSGHGSWGLHIAGAPLAVRPRTSTPPAVLTCGHSQAPNRRERTGVAWRERNFPPRLQAPRCFYRGRAAGQMDGRPQLDFPGRQRKLRPATWRPASYPPPLPDQLVAVASLSSLSSQYRSSHMNLTGDTHFKICSGQRLLRRGTLRGWPKFGLRGYESDMPRQQTFS